MIRTSPRLADLSGRKTALFAGGGLHSWVLARALSEADAEVSVYHGDVGQAAPAGEFLDDMKALGVRTIEVDLRGPMAEIGLETVRCQARYGRSYWNTTGALRAVLVSRLAPLMVEDGCEVVVHGSVSGGNDERRFARYLARFAPDLAIFPAWSAPELLARFHGRDAMVDWLHERGVGGGLRDLRRGSCDGSLMGTSHEAPELEEGSLSWLEASFRQTVLPHDAPVLPLEVEVEIVDGRIHRIGETSGSPLDLMIGANALAGPLGIGLSSGFERRLSGRTCRGIYEAPGVSFLGEVHSRAYEAMLAPDALDLVLSLSERLGKSLYAGSYFESWAAHARTALLATTSELSSTVRVVLYKGQAHVVQMTGSLGDHIERRFGSGGHRWQTGGCRPRVRPA